MKCEYMQSQRLTFFSSFLIIKKMGRGGKNIFPLDISHSGEEQCFYYIAL